MMYLTATDRHQRRCIVVLSMTKSGRENVRVSIDCQEAPRGHNPIATRRPRRKGQVRRLSPGAA